jgi:hypothetical protein
MLFGRTKPEEKTVLILDVENGSVGSALVRLQGGESPKLFGETRFDLPVLHTRDSASLMREVDVGLRHALVHAAEVAARVRNHASTEDAGMISNAAVFMSAPWGSPNLAAGQPDFASSMAALVATRIDESLGRVPQSLYTTAGAAHYSVRHILPYDERYLLCVISGEISELVLVVDGEVVGYATMPLGRHLGVRTLRSHGGLSDHEARSAMRLNASHLAEPMSAAANHYAEQLAETAADLLKLGRVEHVYIVAHDGAGDWFGKALAQSEVMTQLFPRGGTVRALRPEHIQPHIAAHAERPDLMLMLQALFTSSRL